MLTIRLLGTGSFSLFVAATRECRNDTVISRLLAGSGWYRHVKPYAEPAMANRRQRGSTVKQSTSSLLPLGPHNLPYMQAISPTNVTNTHHTHPDRSLHGSEKCPDDPPVTRNFSAKINRRVITRGAETTVIPPPDPLSPVAPRPHKIAHRHPLPSLLCRLGFQTMRSLIPSFARHATSFTQARSPLRSLLR